MDLQIYLQVLLKITLNFLAAVLIAVFGLAYLYLDERRDKQNKKAYLAGTIKGQ
jgi:sensor domain CHASE-containing protein